jgi:hypothetical protein
MPTVSSTVIPALAALIYSVNVFAQAPIKNSFVGFGAGVDIPPFVSGCLSIMLANFHIGEDGNKEVQAPSAQINLFGENTCTGGFFQVFGISQNIAFIEGPAGNSIVGSGTIQLSPNSGAVNFDIRVAAIGQRAVHTWGTNNYLDATIRIIQTYDTTAKPARAALSIAGSVDGAGFNASFNDMASSIGSQRFETTIIGPK